MPCLLPRACESVFGWTHGRSVCAKTDARNPRPRKALGKFLDNFYLDSAAYTFAMAKQSTPKPDPKSLTILEAPLPQNTSPRALQPRTGRPARRRNRGATHSLAVAIRAVERRLVAAIRERDKAAREWAVWNAKATQSAGEYQIKSTEVISLQSTITVLRGQQSPGFPQAAVPSPDPRQVTMGQVMSDQYIPPPPTSPQAQTLVPASLQIAPQTSIPMPVVELPASLSRGGGAAIGPDQGAPTEDLDEDEHLRTSAMNTSGWI